jgi:hypothetical protein
MLQPGEKKLNAAQQAAMYKDVVKREAIKLAKHYQSMCVESNNTWPEYRMDCYAAALKEVEARYD